MLMKILALDTALHQCSGAILECSPERNFAREDANILACESLYISPKRQAGVANKKNIDAIDEKARGHGEAIAPMAAGLLAKANLEVRDIDRVVVTIGPGGFTGVRVGLAFVRGLVLGQNLDVVGVSSLAAMAASFPDDPNTFNKSASNWIAPLIDARREEIFGALYERDKNGTLTEYIAPFVDAPDNIMARLRAPEIVSKVQLEGVKLQAIGSGAVLVDDIEGAALVQNNDSTIDPVALAVLGAQMIPNHEMPAPLYLRAPDAKPSAKAMFAQLGLV